MRADWRWPGARWWRCDLHVHTPASYDYAGASDYAAWAEGVVASGVDAVAITDHNSADGIHKARAALAGRAVVFPGVELTVAHGVHLLVLFDPESGPEHVNHYLSKVDVPLTDRKKKEARSQRSLEDAMRIATECGGLCILAHVDGKKGLLHSHVQRGKTPSPGDPARKALQSPHVAAVGVKDPDSELLKWVDGTIPDYLPPDGRPLPQIRSSDAHKPEQIGKLSTWIKMTTPTLDGLRLALMDGELSVLPAESDVDPNEEPDLAIESITVTQTRYMGRRAPLTLTWSPWLNAVIGGRGTGKSTIVELLRKTLRREGGLPNELRDDWDEMMQVPKNRHDNGILTRDTVLHVVYRKDGQRFRINYDEQGSLPPIEAENQDGTWAPRTGSRSPRVPPVNGPPPC